MKLQVTFWHNCISWKCTLKSINKIFLLNGKIKKITNKRKYNLCSAHPSCLIWTRGRQLNSRDSFTQIFICPAFDFKPLGKNRQEMLFFYRGWNMSLNFHIMFLRALYIVHASERRSTWFDSNKPIWIHRTVRYKFTHNIILKFFFLY